MKNRSRDGGGFRSLKVILCCRIRSLQLDLPSLSVEEVVEHLRCSYPDYRRLQLQAFTRTVSQSLAGLRSSTGPKQCVTEEDQDSSGTTVLSSRDSSRKRHKSNHLDEERVGRFESKHLRKSRNKFVSSTPSSSSLDEDKDSDTDGTTSEPKFDLMKSMIRSNYAAVSSKSVVEKVEEKIIEVEVDDKDKKIESDAVNGTENVSTSNVNFSKVFPDFEGRKEKGSRFSDFGGMKSILDDLRLEVICPLFIQPQILKGLGVTPMTGILLYGPPGCGKTKLAHAIANEAGVSFYQISATQVISGVSGESEENIRNLFLKAHKTAPSIVFIDEIDAIGSKRENLQREMERRVVAQLLICMDDMHQTHTDLRITDSVLSSPEKVSGHVLVIGATNRPDALDPALRRPGRFDCEISLRVPDENARLEIMSILTHNLRLRETIDLREIARATPGYVGADLAELVKKAGRLALRRIMQEKISELGKELKDTECIDDLLKKSLTAEKLEEFSYTMADFNMACKYVQCSSKREGFSVIPDTKWEDVGGLESLRAEFYRLFIHRIKYPEVCKAFGQNRATGVLLYGPPGCGKTLIAKAVASESGANFIYVKGPELLSKFVGDSELGIRTTFSRARTAAPCIIFFDEVDALATNSGQDGDNVVARVLKQLLIELDGADGRLGVYVIGATNRLELMDHAILRPGRFDKILYVSLPGPDDRVQILRTLCRKMPLASDVNLDAIGRNETCNNFSGADLTKLVNTAADLALDDLFKAGAADLVLDDLLKANELGITPSWVIEAFHFEKALKKTFPSVSTKQRRNYKVVSQRYKLI